MGYYIRVLGRKDVPLSIAVLRACMPVDSGAQTGVSGWEGARGRYGQNLGPRT